MFRRIRGIIALSLVIPGMAGAVNVTISGTDNGRIFHGIGLVSQGTSQAIPDYAEPYRSNILDLMFKPKFGMSLQRMRFEIGSGVNTTSGSEPSHAIVPGEIVNPVPRGLEYWLVNEAKTRNPKFETEACNWSLPLYIQRGSKQQKADYYAAVVKCLKNTYGWNLDYLNFNTNEAGYDIDFVKNYLRPTLNNDGYSFVKLTGPDQYGSTCWTGIESDMNNDAAFRDAVGVVANHNTATDDNDHPTAGQIASGKMLGNSEMHGPSGDNWSDVLKMAWMFNLNYAQYKEQFTELWYTVDAMYYGNFMNCGGMNAKTSWSGYYEVKKRAWGYAHTTQFTDLGWKYLDNACALINGDRTNSYVTLRDTAGNNWSMIIVTNGSSQSITGTITNGLSTGTLHVWKSDANAQFVQQADITPSGGSFTVNCAANSIYSLTTTTGQQKGSYTIAPASSLPLPLQENYEGYTPGQNPRFHSQQFGSWEAFTGGPGNRKCLRQIAKGGDDAYSQQACVCFPVSASQTSADVYIDSLPPCRVMLVTHADGGYGNPRGFQLQKNGAWAYVQVHDWNLNTTLTSGTIGGFDGSAWHTMKVNVSGGTAYFYVDNSQVGSYAETAQNSNTLRSSYHYNLFDNLYIGDGTSAASTPVRRPARIAAQSLSISNRAIAVGEAGRHTISIANLSGAIVERFAGDGARIYPVDKIGRGTYVMNAMIGDRSICQRIVIR